MDAQNFILRVFCEIKKALYRVIMKNLFIGKKVSFRKGFFIRISGGKVKIKSKCFFNNYCSINSLGYVEVGENCCFGENVKIYDHNHKYSKDTGISKNEYNIGTVIIKNNVWIGSNVTILKDVTIGSNVVIGANCLIREDIPDNSVVLSNSNIEIKNMM